MVCTDQREWVTIPSISFHAIPSPQHSQFCPFARFYPGSCCLSTNEFPVHRFMENFSQTLPSDFLFGNSLGSASNPQKVKSIVMTDIKFTHQNFMQPTPVVPCEYTELLESFAPSKLLHQTKAIKNPVHRWEENKEAPSHNISVDEGIACDLAIVRLCLDICMIYSDQHHAMNDTNTNKDKIAEGAQQIQMVPVLNTMTSSVRPKETCLSCLVSL